MAKLQDLKVRISLDSSQFKSGIDKVEQQTSSLKDSMKNLGGIIAGAFATKAVIDFGKKVFDVGKKVFSVGMEYNALKETSETTWKTLLGSQKAAIDQLKEIEDFAARTPFSKMGVDTMAKYLHNAGYEGQEVFDTLEKIGDMGSAFGVQEDSLVEMTRQFSQVQQAGVAYTEDLNILADRGIPIYQAIADATGVAVSEVKKMASEGKITAEVYNEAIDSMAETTDGAMQAQSETFSGMMSTLQDNLSQLAGLLTENLFNAIKGVLDVMLPLVDAFINAYKESGSLSQAFAEVLGPVLEDIGVNVELLQKIWETFSGIIQHIWDTTFKPVWDAMMDTVKTLWEKFQEYMPAIQHIVEDVFDIIQTVWETFLKPVFDAIGHILQNVLFPTWERVFKQGILPIVDVVFKTIVDLWDNSLKPMLEGIISFIDGVFKGDWEQVWNSISDIFGGIWEGLQTLVKRPLNYIIDMINKVINGLNSLQVPDWVPLIGGKGINIPRIPKLWKGSNFTLEGPTLVGEQGPELVNMPRGASVMPAHKTRSMLEGVGKAEVVGRQTANIYVELDGRTLAKTMGANLVDVVRLKTGLSL